MHIVYGEHCMRGCSCWSVVWLWASLVYCVNYKMHIGLEGLHNCRWVWSIPTTVVQVLVGWVAVGSSWRSRRGAVSRPDWVLTIISSRSQVRRRRGVSSCAPTYPTNTNTNTNTNANTSIRIWKRLRGSQLFPTLLKASKLISVSSTRKNSTVFLFLGV